MQVVDQLKNKESFALSAGQTMVGIVKKYGKPLYMAHMKLSSIILDKVDFVALFDWNKANTFPSTTGLTNSQVHKEVRLSSSTLILYWIAGHALEKLEDNDTLYDAERWAGVPENQMLSKALSEEEISEIQIYLSQFSFNHNIIPILPYLTELFETGDELLIESGIGRKNKKKNGIYYTPLDVVRFMTERSYLKYLERKTEKNVKWLDPAAGTGVFLIEALKILLEKQPKYSIYNKLQLSKSCIYGMDISVIALQTAAILLSINILIDDNTPSSNFVFRKVAKKIGSNLKVIDSTQVSLPIHIKSIYGSNHKGFFDIIVSNPPYAKSANLQTALFGNYHKTDKVSKNIYPHFVKLLYNLTDNDFGVGSIVVPLSIVTSSTLQFRSLRRYIQSIKNGETEFWNFDRTPDSLFGDDVKTRNTILFFSKRELGGRHNMKSSYLSRWSSRNRSSLFDNVCITKIDSEIIKGVPKIGDLVGYNLYKEVKESNLGLFEEIVVTCGKNSTESASFFTKSTAYNWLTVQLPDEYSVENQAGLVPWKLRVKNLNEHCIYALLSSRLSFWLWRVYGDGFHLTRTFINNLPYGVKFFEEIDQIELALLGKKLWKVSSANRIETSNAGKASYSFSPYSDSDTLNQIDNLVLKGLKIQLGNSNFLKSYIYNLICAGREKEIKFAVQNKDKNYRKTK